MTRPGGSIRSASGYQARQGDTEWHGTVRRRANASGEQTEEDLGVPVRPFADGHMPAWLGNAEDLGTEPRNQREGNRVKET